MINNLFEINNLYINHHQKTLLKIDNLTLPSSKVIAIIGANGAGKSTLLHALLGQVQGCKLVGNITCLGQPSEKLIKEGKVAWVGQHEKYNAPLTVLDYALLGTIPNTPWYKQPPNDAIIHAEQFLAEFELLELKNMRIQTLSGGEKQRLAMVRALMQHTQILLLDEPTNHLDIKHQRKLFSYLKNLVDNTSQQNKSIIMVLHSLTDAYNQADYVVALAQGEILATGIPDEVMTADNLQRMYDVPITIIDTDNGKVFV